VNYYAERKDIKLTSFYSGLSSIRACLSYHISKMPIKKRKMVFSSDKKKMVVDYEPNKYFLVYKQGDVIKVSSKGFIGSYGSNSRRGVIKDFSKRARKRMVEFIHRFRINKKNYRLYCGTLTYENIPESGVKVKNDLEKFWKRLKYNYPVRSMIWVAEFQKRGAIHFHFVLVVDKSIVAKGFRDIIYFRNAVAKIWNSVVHGSEKHLKAGTQLDLVKGNIVGYFAKYLGKYEQKEVPGFFKNIGRFWGVLGRKALFFYKMVYYLISEDFFYYIRREIRKVLEKRGYKYKFYKRYQGISYYGDVRCLPGILEYI